MSVYTAPVELFEHCWHINPKRPETVHIKPLICCHCGTRASREWVKSKEPPDGHGRFHPTGEEVQVFSIEDGPELCNRKGRAAD